MITELRTLIDQTVSEYASELDKTERKKLAELLTALLEVNRLAKDVGYND